MDMPVEVTRERLMAYAARRGDALTQAFAGAVCTAMDQGMYPARMFSLGDTQFAGLLDRYFPGAWHDLFAVEARASAESACPSFREDEIQDLVALLLDHRSRNGDEETWLAYAIAIGCMGGNHLWQDLGLTGRQDLSDLLRNHFAALHDKNVANMKWKKFFYKQLCDRAEVSLCKAPSCQVCDDYPKCFGPEAAA